MTDMIGREELVKTVLQAADGEIVGRIRLQKIFYLLEQLGMGGDIRFSYHHYGPYSEELSDAIDFAIKADKTVQEEAVKVESGFYSIYRLSNPDEPAPPKLGNLPWAQARECIRAMKAETSIVIELAATIHWLREKEDVPDWRKELKVRKPSKADDSRIAKALDLLESTSTD